jgi:hypothetical protein
VHRHGRDGPRTLTMVERSHTTMVLRVVDVASPIGNRRHLSRSSWGMDNVCGAIFSEEKRGCQR